ncbi:MAG: MerR family DNA-binding transcriptional regulator [Oleiphilaceae bacterium]|nr:MerR family DNA-binding transcriptional regulator [Oleiphilaceae bacterium]
MTQPRQHSARHYTIGELASEFDITTRTIRFYEEAGLLSPARQGQQRIYQESDRVKLKLILRGKRLGFSLAESRELIEQYDPVTGNRSQLKALLDKIEERRESLRQQMLDIQLMQTELDAVAGRCHEALAELDRQGRDSPKPADIGRKPPENNSPALNEDPS